MCMPVPPVVPAPILRSFMIDASDHSKFEESKRELHALLERPQLDGIPILVLGNKCDLPNAIGVEQIIDVLSVTSLSCTATHLFPVGSNRLATERCAATL